MSISNVVKDKIYNIKDSLKKRIAIEIQSFYDLRNRVETIKKMGTRRSGELLLPSFYYLRKRVYPIIERKYLSKDYMEFSKENRRFKALGFYDSHIM